MLMPGQKVISAIDYHAMRDAKVDELTFTVGYSCSRKSYENVSVVGVSMNANIVQSRVDNKNDRLKDISYALQTISERMD